MTMNNIIKMKLTNINVGSSAIIERIDCKEKVKNRLSYMGIIEGVKIKFVRTAPFNDPIEISVRGFYLAIRRSVADRIQVKE